MILTGFLFGFVLSFAVVNSRDVEPVVPSTSASETSADVDPVSNLLLKLDDVALIPETRGRSDVEIEEEEIPEDQPPQGYFYPKPSKRFDLPVFKTLQPDAALDGSSHLNPGLEDGGELERLPRSPQRPQSLFPYANIQRPRPRPQHFYPIPTDFPNRFPGRPIRPLPYPGSPYRG